MSQYDDILAQGKQVLDDHKRHQSLMRKIKFSKTLRDLFWILALAAVIIIGSYEVYQNRSNILTFVEAKTGVNPLAVLTPAAPAAAPAAASVTSGCDTSISVTASGSQLQITPTPKIGNCYTIAENSRDGWAKVIGSDTELPRFAQYIYDKSASKDLDVTGITARLKASLGNWTVDLRSVQAQAVPSATVPVAVAETASPTATLSPTQVPATPTPEIIPTATVMVVPWPEKERGFSLEEMAKVMTSHNISTVIGENKDMSPQGRTKWMLKYPTPDGGSDYLVFSMIGSDLPAKCHNGTELTLSLVTTGDPNEMWLTAGDYKLAFICN